MYSQRAARSELELSTTGRQKNEEAPSSSSLSSDDLGARVEVVLLHSRCHLSRRRGGGLVVGGGGLWLLLILDGDRGAARPRRHVRGQRPPRRGEALEEGGVLPRRHQALAADVDLARGRREPRAVQPEQRVGRSLLLFGTSLLFLGGVLVVVVPPGDPERDGVARREIVPPVRVVLCRHGARGARVHRHPRRRRRALPLRRGLHDADQPNGRDDRVLVVCRLLDELAGVPTTATTRLRVLDDGSRRLGELARAHDALDVARGGAPRDAAREAHIDDRGPRRFGRVNRGRPSEAGDFGRDEDDDATVGGVHRRQQGAQQRGRRGDRRAARDDGVVVVVPLEDGEVDNEEVQNVAVAR
mmetsp:Transcript_23768/g.94217  ORF Transcript_23768/g.94217 Transcript_23768/m.94217 type:complete len:357 (-) Transcript_23768:901-1971(-)